MAPRRRRRQPGAWAPVHAARRSGSAMTTAVAAPGAVSVITFAEAFGPADARALARHVRADAATGARAFVVDLTSAHPIAEGPLVLALLSVRGELRRIAG